MGGPDTQNQYQPQNEQDGSGNTGINPVQHSGPNPHDIPSSTTAANAAGIHPNHSLTQYPPTPIPLDQAAQLQQPSAYPQYEQQQQPHSTVPPSVFDSYGNPVPMPPQSQMPYTEPSFILDDGFPLNYDPNELAAIENMLGDGLFNFSMDWNDDTM